MSSVANFSHIFEITGPDLPIHYVVIQNWNEFYLVVIVNATAVKQQMSKLYPQIQPTDARDHVFVSQWPVINIKASLYA